MTQLDDRPDRARHDSALANRRSFASFRTYLGETWRRRGLVRVLSARQLKGSYEMNLVGFAWWILEPLSYAVVYYVLVVIVFRSDRPHYLLTLLVALLPFKWLSQSVTKSIGTVRSNATLIMDVYFPRALLPLTETTIGLAHFGIGLLIVPLFMLGYRVWGGPSILWLPLVAATQWVLILGLAYPLSVWGVRFRNLPNVVTNLLRLWFYLSPAIWTLDRIEDRRALIQLVVRLNPLTGLFESYRRVLIEGRPPSLDLAWTALVGILLFVGGIWYFARREGQFAKLL